MSGYPCGVLNEFYELKPGETASDLLAYNGESILLCEWERTRNVTSDDVLPPLHADRYRDNHLVSTGKHR